MSMNGKTSVSRRGALLGLGAASAATLAAPAVAQSGRTLTMVTTWPRSLPGLATAAGRLVDRVNAMSGGDLRIEYFAAGEKVAPFDSFPATQSGEADMYHAAEYYWQGRNRAYNFFTTVPFGFTATEFTAWINNGGGQALWDELSAEFGLKALMAGNTGVQMGGWYNRPVRSIEDMKGMRIRIPGLAADIFRAFGAEPVSLPGGAIPAALFSGEIDAVEWVGPYNDLEFGVHKALRYYMYPGFHEPGTAVSLGMNKGVWDSLDARQQKIIETAAAAENREMLAEYSAKSGRALTQMQVEYGTEVIRFPDDLYAEAARINADTMQDIAGESRFSRRVVESFLEYRDRVMPFSKEMNGLYAERRASYLDQAKQQEVFDDIVD